MVTFRSSFRMTYLEGFYRLPWSLHGSNWRHGECQEEEIMLETGIGIVTIG
jgi:hypothetical protein